MISLKPPRMVRSEMHEPERQQQTTATNLDLLVLRDYLGDRSPYKQYRAQPAAKQQSLASLIATVDALFKDYINEECEWQTATKWLTALEKRPLSGILREQFKKISDPSFIELCGEQLDFSDPQILSPDKLSDTLLALGRVVDLVTEEMRKNWVLPRSGVPLCHATQYLFDNCFDDSDGRFELTIESFFKHLRDHVFFKREESIAELDMQRSTAIYLEFDSLCELIYKYIAAVAPQNGDISLHLRAIHSVINIRAFMQEQEQRSKFMENLNDFTLDNEPPSVQHIMAILEHFHPEYCANDPKKYYIELTWISDTPYLISKDNFLLTRKDSPSLVEEWELFPPDGAHALGSLADIRDGLVGGKFDISVFDTDGHKVFWGDLMLTAIKKIKGPFYVLSQADSYTSIPSKMVEGTMESRDIHREEVLQPLLKKTKRDRIRRSLGEDLIATGGKAKDEASKINPDYMRAISLGVIEDGTFKPNHLDIKAVRI